jgi:Ca2+-binding EF-hand superfamily protein
VFHSSCVLHMESLLLHSQASDKRLQLEERVSDLSQTYSSAQLQQVKYSYVSLSFISSFLPLQASDKRMQLELLVSELSEALSSAHTTSVMIEAEVTTRVEEFKRTFTLEKLDCDALIEDEVTRRVEGFQQTFTLEMIEAEVAKRVGEKVESLERDLVEAREARLMYAFDVFDVDGNGRLDAEEFRQIGEVGWSPEDAFDAFDELKVLLQAMLMDGEWSAEQSLETFESLDKNRDGWVDRVEFTAFYAVSSPILLAPTVLMATLNPCRVSSI